MTSEVASHHFYYVLFIRNESSPHSRRGEYIGHEDQEVRTHGVHLKFVYHREYYKPGKSSGVVL
jgi:hypothetical protein